MEEQVLERVKRLYVACQQRTTDHAEDVLLKDVSRLLRSSGHSFLLGEQGARRGAAHELRSVALMIESAGDRPDTETLVQAEKIEVWREAEALIRRPHTFEVLKQLPELRQIISHSAVGAVSAAAGSAQQATVAAGLESQRRRQPRSRAASDDGSDKLTTGRQTDLQQQYRSSNLACLGADQPCLLPLLMPQLRLQLAAEVAAGMLCPGQAPPPDTLEHASALQLFVDEALRHINDGLQSHHRATAAPDAAGASEAAVADTLAATEGDDVPAPAPGKAGGWLLAPHLALRLQLPPHQLLQLACEFWLQQPAPGGRCSCTAAGSACQGAAAAQTPSSWRLLQPEHQAALADLLQGQMADAEDVHRTMQSFASEGGSAAVAAAALLSSATSNKQLNQALPAALVVGFLQRQWASSGGGSGAAWQQAVPVQAALLLLLAEQLAAAMADASRDVEQRSSAGSPAGSEPAHTQDGSGAGGPPAAVLGKVVELLQLLRNFSDWNGAFDAAAGAQPPGGSSSSTVVSEEPSRFFSSSGPLSRGLWGLSEPPGFGIWASTWPATPAAAGAALSAATGGAAAASSWSLSSEASLSRAAQRQQLLRQLAAQVMLAQGCWGLAVHSADIALLRDAKVLHSSLAGLQMLLAASPEEPESLPGHLQAVLHYDERLQQAGIDVGIAAVVASADLQPWMSELLLQHRAQQLEAQGLQEQPYDTSTGWLSGPVLQPAAPSAAPSPAAGSVHASSTENRSEGSSRRSSQGGSSRRCSEASGRRSSSEGSSGSSACLRARPRCSGDSDGDVSSDEPAESAEVGIAASPWSSDCGEQLGGGCNGSSAVGAAGMAPDAATSARSGPEIVRQTLEQGRLAARQLGGAAAAPLAPLHTWLKRQHVHQRVQLAQARQWWHSGRRQQAAGGAVAGIPEAGPRSSRTSRSADGPAGQQQQQQQGARHADNGFWRAGEHDRHPDCDLCRSEQQKQDGHKARAARHTAVFSSPAVAWSDPFMWRRLLWQLLGKLSPAAQAFYARSLAVCPHCCSTSVWLQVARSIKGCLWSGADAEVDLTDLALITGTSGELEQQRRLTLLKQHARALNGSFSENYRPGCTVLARQVLLALSPLHHAVLPAPETAALCPSSFPALAGKLLQQQLLSRPVLDGFQHDGGSRASSSDFWWHNGLRRWAAFMQPSSQQQPGPPTLSLQELEQLYGNPDARLYAAAFAVRQLCGSVNSQMPVPAASTAALHKQLVAETRGHQTALIAGHFPRAKIQQLAAEFRMPEQEVADAVERQVSAAAAGSLHAHDWRSLLRLVQQPADAHLAPAAAGAQALGELLSEAQLLQAAYNSKDADGDGPSGNGGGGQAAAARQLTAALERALGRLLGGRFRQASDVQQLLLSGPAMVEALLPPGLWWQKQQELLELDACDACGKASAKASAGKAVCCRGCECALYCSRQCQEADAQDHALVCDRLRTTPNYESGVALLRLVDAQPGEPACLSAGGGGLARCADSPDGGLVPLADFALHAAKEVRALGCDRWHLMSMMKTYDAVRSL